MGAGEIKRVFISYSHDSEEHKRWVLNLATRLRDFGIDATLDQWELKAGDDIPHFMEKHLSNSDYIVMVCTERYVEKANKGTGGVGYEKMIITSDIMQNIDSNKAIPIIKQSIGKDIPVFIKTKLYIDFSKDSQYEFAFEELARTILTQPIFKKPELGSNAFAATENTKPQKTVEPLNNLICVIAEFYNLTGQHIPKGRLHKNMGINRIMLDIIIQKAVNDGLVREHFYTNSDTEFSLTNDGKIFAVENGLID